MYSQNTDNNIFLFIFLEYFFSLAPWNGHNLCAGFVWCSICAIYCVYFEQWRRECHCNAATDDTLVGMSHQHCIFMRLTKPASFNFPFRNFRFYNWTTISILIVSIPSYYKLSEWMLSAYLPLCTRVSRMDFVELFRDCGPRLLKLCANASKPLGSSTSNALRGACAVEWVRFRLLVRSGANSLASCCCWCVNTKFGKLGECSAGDSTARFGLFGAAIFVISGNLRCRSNDEFFRGTDLRGRIFSVRGSCSNFACADMVSMLRSRSSKSITSISCS